MESHGFGIGYIIGRALLPLAFFIASLVVIIVLIVKRSNEKKNETFEDRDN